MQHKLSERCALNMEGFFIFFWTSVPNYVMMTVVPDTKLRLRERCEYGFQAAEDLCGRFRCRAVRTRRFFVLEEENMETRVAVMSVIVENADMVERLNAILHEYGEFIIGRMGIPYRKRKVNIIAIALDAPQNTISALSGKIGALPGISVKTAYSSVMSTD